MAFTLTSGLEHHRRQRALRGCALDVDLPMLRGASANEVWIGRDVVLRVASELRGEPVPLGGASELRGEPVPLGGAERGIGRLAREARIVAQLPPDARYPEVLAAGGDSELEWLLTRRVPGEELGRMWPVMSSALRERAIHELAGALTAIHEAPIDAPEGDLLPPHTLPLEPLLGLIDDVRDLGGDRFTLDALEAFVRERWNVFDAADLGLAHGDPHLENVLWDGEHVTAVLDLEWSRQTWIHCDLEILLAICDHPALFAAADYEARLLAPDFTDVPRWLAAAQPSWFAHPRLLERLEVLHVSRTLGLLVESMTSEVRWRHLRAVLDGTSFLRRVITPR